MVLNSQSHWALTILLPLLFLFSFTLKMPALEAVNAGSFSIPVPCFPAWASSPALSVGLIPCWVFFLCCVRALQAYRAPAPGTVLVLL